MLSFWSETLREPASLAIGVRGHVPGLRGGLAFEMVSPFQVTTRSHPGENPVPDSSARTGAQAKEPELEAARPRVKKDHTPNTCDIALPCGPSVTGLGPVRV